MKPAPFAYAKARSLDEAIALLGEHGDGARLLAGGQSLLATLNMRLSAPRILIDINSIAGLDRIELKDGKIEIGALLRHVQAERAREIAEHAPLIARALPHIAHPAIRNRGTIGGSIAFADPAAELPACLLALNGEVEITSAKDRRTVKADDFFKGLFETALGPHDVLVAIRLPAATAQSRVGFAEFARRRGDYAMWAWRPARTPTARNWPTCGWPFSVSAQRRCAQGGPKPSLQAASSMQPLPRSMPISIRLTIFRQPAP